MRIFSWNVNGIRAVMRKGTFLPFIRKRRPDVLCLQETKAERDESPVDLPEYEEYWNSARKKGYAGTAIFSKERPRAVSMNLPEAIAKKFGLAEDGYGNPNDEGRVITAEYPRLFIVNVYTPNAKGDLSRLSLRARKWDPAFLAHVKSLDRKKPVVFCGDFNVAHTPEDLAHPKENEGEHGFTKEERAGVDRILRAGFVDTFRHFTPRGNGHYTWWSHFANARARNVGWRIDYVFVSARLAPKLARAFILPDVEGSDHCPVGIELDL